ncbi:MAG: serine hydroxymethyltransferase [Desulfurococcales archaeon]|jgi:glycine hydroxymethyltransferase|nr:serine hydroxymethyltransferase [Desulfurococcales archaeon]
MSIQAPNELSRIINLTIEHNTWRRSSLNLIPSENVMSPLAEAVYMCDMMHRYAEGRPRRRLYQGLIYVDEVEELVMDLMSRLFGAKYVEPRPISGTIANAATFRVLAAPGSKAVVAPVQAGAHVSHTKFGTLGALGIEHIEMPFDMENLNIDVDKARKVIEEVKPAFVVMGGSLYLFPHPIKEISEAAHSVNAVVVYDAAHVLGLIAGKRWRDPFAAGADIVTASTHKTFPGPQGGVILTNNESLYKSIARTIFPWFVSNHHLHRLPATAVTTIEMIHFGESYADQIVRNAKAFAEALAAEGFKVLGEHLGYTRSHQVVIDVKAHSGGAKAATLLEKANIIVNKNLLPYDPPEAVRDPSGLRTGVQEMTRYGMKEGDFREIARFFRMILIDGRDPEDVRKKVIDFRMNFTSIQYTFDIDLSSMPSPYKIPFLSKV